MLDLLSSMPRVAILDRLQTLRRSAPAIFDLLQLVLGGFKFGHDFQAGSFYLVALFLYLFQLSLIGLTGRTCRLFGRLFLSADSGLVHALLYLRPLELGVFEFLLRLDGPELGELGRLGVITEQKGADCEQFVVQLLGQELHRLVFGKRIDGSSCPLQRSIETFCGALAISEILQSCDATECADWPQALEHGLGVFREIRIPLDDFKWLEHWPVIDFPDQQCHELREPSGVLGEVLPDGLDWRQALVQLHPLDHIL